MYFLSVHFMGAFYRAYCGYVTCQKAKTCIKTSSKVEFLCGFLLVRMYKWMKRQVGEKSLYGDSYLPKGINQYKGKQTKLVLIRISTCQKVQINTKTSSPGCFQEYSTS